MQSANACHLTVAAYKSLQISTVRLLPDAGVINYSVLISPVQQPSQETLDARHAC